MVFFAVDLLDEVALLRAVLRDLVFRETLRAVDRFPFRLAGERFGFLRVGLTVFFARFLLAEAVFRFFALRLVDRFRVVFFFFLARFEVRFVVVLRALFFEEEAFFREDAFFTVFFFGKPDEDSSP